MERVGVGVVEDPRRDDGADAHVAPAGLAAQRGGAFREDEGGTRREALHLRVPQRGLVVGRCGDGDDRVAHRHAWLQAAAGADPDEPFGAEHAELLEHDAGARTPHPGGLHADRAALEGAREAEHPALGVHLPEARVEERLGDVLRPQRIARAEHGRRIVAGFGAQVDRHARESNDGPDVPRSGTAPRSAALGYFRNLLVVLSARILPPVWQVGQ